MFDKKNIVLFGSTGSIGANCLEVVSRYPKLFQVAGLAAKNNFELLAQQANRYKPAVVAIANPQHTDELKDLLPSDTALLTGDKGIRELLDYINIPIDIAVNAMVGASGLVPSLRTLEKGITLGLANKESLVMAGSIVLETARRTGAALLPIDSEHSAIFQCLLGENAHALDKIILTASGGPFFERPAEEFDDITPEEALKHPNWDMGPRITVDSATMLNKGLEVIEARWLFDLPPDRIDVVIHRQSIVHSLIMFIDGSYIAQMGAPDMRLPIQFALTYPQRLPSPYSRLDFNTAFCLDFHPVPLKKFPCLELAYEALDQGGIAPAVLNAADEAAVEAFLRGKIKFTGIADLIAESLNKIQGSSQPGLDEILEADEETRRFVQSTVQVEF